MSQLFKTLVVALLLCTVAPAYALKVGDVEMPDSLEFDTGAGGATRVKMDLNGAGIRTKLMAKLYVAGLYLSSPVSGGDAIVASEDPMAMRLQITSSLVTVKRMEKAMREGFEKAAGKELPAIADRVDKMVSTFQSGIAEGDIYEFVWSPGKGSQINKNGNEAAVISGLDFKQALFGILIGAKPAQKSLKVDLLGKSAE